MLAAPMDHLLLAASIALNTADAAPEPLEQQCAGHPLQERFLADRSRVRVLVTSRRTGKTVVLCVDAARTAARVEPGTWVLYVTKTRKNAKAVAWPEIKRVLRESGHAYTANESDLTITISGGGSILLGGADKITEIEKYRGFNFALAIVDECGTYPSDLLESLRDEVLEPATIDTGGRMIFSGTPGPTLSGAWYEMSGPQASDVHRGTLLDNPHLMRHLPPEQRRAAIVEFLAEVRERNGWTEESPTYVREWLGKWAQDDSVLVFPFEPERNGWTPAAGPLGLPSHSTTGVLLAVQDWRAVVALDAGYTDANGYAVLATHPHRREVFVLEAHKRRGQLIEAAAQEIRTLRERYTIDGRQPAVVSTAYPSRRRRSGRRRPRSACCAMTSYRAGCAFSQVLPPTRSARSGASWHGMAGASRSQTARTTTPPTRRSMHTVTCATILGRSRPRHPNQAHNNGTRRSGKR
jgi:hypothetical protein